jgi:multidrug efflux pump subunit AcrB
MHLRLLAILAAANLALVAGCGQNGGPARGVTGGPTVVVTASYAGANARVVADTVAAPIEQQVNGVEGYVWMESESRKDGSYVARVRFNPEVDPKRVVQLVRDRVALAEPQLPEEVKRAGVSVKVGAPDGASKPVVIAVEDRGDLGQEALRHEAAKVVKRLVKEGAAREPEMFPGPFEKQVVTLIDRARCAKAGVAVAAVWEALRRAGPSATPYALKKLAVTSAKGNKVPLGSIASFKEVFGPVVVYRVNLWTSVRISGFPPEGKAAADAAAQWVKLAEDELGTPFGVENLTPK